MLYLSLNLEPQSRTSWCVPQWVVNLMSQGGKVHLVPGWLKIIKQSFLRIFVLFLFQFCFFAWTSYKNIYQFPLLGFYSSEWITRSLHCEFLLVLHYNHLIKNSSDFAVMRMYGADLVAVDHFNVKFYNLKSSAFVLTQSSVKSLIITLFVFLVSIR